MISKLHLREEVIHIQNQEIFDNPGISCKASAIPAESVSPENAGMVGFRHFRQFRHICQNGSTAVSFPGDLQMHANIIFMQAVLPSPRIHHKKSLLQMHHKIYHSYQSHHLWHWHYAHNGICSGLISHSLLLLLSTGCLCQTIQFPDLHISHSSSLGNSWSMRTDPLFNMSIFA